MENIEKKKQLYINDFVAVFGRFPEGWTPKRQQEVPELEKFISSKIGADKVLNCVKSSTFYVFLLS